MEQSFKHYYFNVLQMTAAHKILLTVSGGIDSMVMLHLFHQAALPVVAAHCNFHLRGEESNRDQAFVEQQCADLGIELSVKHFDVESYQRKHKVSVQMAARDLRYAWFEELRLSRGLDYIATAHHRDDNAETFLINLVRGTGVAGLHGIPRKTTTLIRPLSFARRADIESYAHKRKIAFVEDSSNSSDKYLRNYLRHHIIPKLVDFNPQFIANLAAASESVRMLEDAFRYEAIKRIEDMLQINGEDIVIDINKLLEINNLKPYLVEFLSQYNFQQSTIEELLRALHSSGSGKRFFSESHRIIKNRNELILSPYHAGIQNRYRDFFLLHEDFSTNAPIHLEMSILDEVKAFDPDPAVGYFNYDKLTFPLILRRWKEGDTFHPFGMKGSKLLSDYFIDMKFSLADKEQTWLLCSGDEIVWVVGCRSDERYKVSADTRKILMIRYGGNKES